MGAPEVLLQPEPQVQMQGLQESRGEGKTRLQAHPGPAGHSRGHVVLHTDRPGMEPLLVPGLPAQIWNPEATLLAHQHQGGRWGEELALELHSG